MCSVYNETLQLNAVHYILYFDFFSFIATEAEKYE